MKKINAPAPSLTEQFKDILSNCSSDELRELSVAFKDIKKEKSEEDKAEKKALREREQELKLERDLERDLERAEKQAQRAEKQAQRAEKQAQRAKKRQSLSEENERAHQKLLNYVPSLEPFKFDVIKGLDVDNYMKVPITEENLLAFLTTSFKYGGKIRYNKSDMSIEHDGEKVDDNFFISLRADVSNFFGKRITDYIDERLRLVAKDNSYDPITKYFDSLTWDGISRIPTLTHTLLNAEDTPLYQEYLRVFFKATIARNYEPACKFDSALVLVGPQGVGKSTLFENLAKRIYSNKRDGSFVITDYVIKDTKQLLEQSSGCVFGIWDELTNFKKAEMTAVKSFMSKASEKARAAYAHETSEVKRRWTIVGSTNTDYFLRDDDSYERRFWIIRCDGFKDPDKTWNALEPLYDDKFLDQVWAEAVRMYKDDPKGSLRLSSEAYLESVKDQSQYKAFYGDDAYDSILKRMESQFCIEGDTITSLVQLTQTPEELAAKGITPTVLPHQVNKILCSALSEWTRKNGVYKYTKQLEQFLKGKWEYKQLKYKDGSDCSRGNKFWVRVETENEEPTSTEKPNQIELVPEPAETPKTTEPAETPKPAEPSSHPIVTPQGFDSSRRMIFGVSQDLMTQYTDVINNRIDANPAVQRNLTQKGQEYLTIDSTIQEFENSPEAKQIEQASNDFINTLNLNLNLN